MRTVAYNGHAIELPDMDFETYSEAGYIWNGKRFVGVARHKKGLDAVGAAAYSEHPSTEIICLAYNLKDGHGGRLWVPGAAPPVDLFAHIRAGGLIEAHNSSFEYYIWRNVGAARLGWPNLPREQLRDSMAKCYSFSLPGSLEKAAEVMLTNNQKDKRGKQLIQQLSVPKVPTKNDLSTRRTPYSHPDLFAEYYDYCRQDIRTESDLSRLLPDLSPYELQVWLLDQKINNRGVHIDTAALADCISVVEQATAKYTEELRQITRGAIQSADQTEKLQGWLAAYGVFLSDMQADTVEAALKRKDLPETDPRRRALWIRSSLGSRSVKKLYSIRHRLSSDGRLREMFAYYGGHTGRFAGRGPQPQNLPATGPPSNHCPCEAYYWEKLPWCPHCGSEGASVDWCAEIVEQALRLIATRDLGMIERLWGDPLALVSGCLRGLFTAAPGYELICSDFSAIEAIVLAVLAGCEWRIEVFRTHGLIYEASASKITGIPFQEFLDHKVRTGSPHPKRKLGKTAELASGYQGWLGAWKQFGAGEFMSDEEIEHSAGTWRKDSPEIPDLWKGLENAFTMAVLQPGRVFSYRGISYGVLQDVMFCRLPSGRCLKYHKPRALMGRSPYGKPQYNLTFEGWNGDYKKGPIGWLRMDTYGGKLTAEVTQATARDIQVNAMLNLEAAGYPIVLHVHDEDCSEVPAGVGSIAEYEQLMSKHLPWFATWPIRAEGGWRGHRYRKD